MPQLLKKWIRILWTLITYPIAGLAAIPGAILGAAWGLAGSLRVGRGAWFGFRAGAQLGAIRGVRDIFSASTWLFKRIFLRRQERDELPSFYRQTREMLIVGHRGSPHLCVENTLNSFRMALKQGANALEIDLCLTRDGVVVLWHDWNPDSTVARYRESGLEASQKYRPYYPEGIFRRPVSDLSLDELRLQYGYAHRDGSPVPSLKKGDTIPTFDEFMYWAVGRKELHCVFLDIKIPPEEVRLVEPFLLDIRRSRERYAPHFDLVLLSPFPPIVAEIKRLEPDWEACQDRQVIDAVPVATQREAVKYSAIRPAQAQGNNYASVGRPTAFTLAPFELYRNIIVEDLRYRHEQGLDTRLIAWTINDTDEMRELLELGVDGILTDYPEKLARRVRKLQGYDVIRTAREWLGFKPDKKSAP